MNLAEADMGRGIMFDDDEIMEKGFGFDIKQVHHKIRDHSRKGDAEYLISLSSDFIFDPPEIARFLDPVAVKMKREKIVQLKHNITTRDKSEVEKCTKELGEMITTDPRLASSIEEHFYKLFVDFLSDEQNQVLQVNALYILIPVVAYTVNREMEMVIKYIKPSTILNLLRPKDCDLMVQALWFLRSIVLASSKPPDIKIKEMIEEALQSMISLITKYSPESEEMFYIADSVEYKVLFTCSMTLAAFCQVHPQLPPDKLESALIAIKKLLRYEVYEVGSNACKGFADLCNGNKALLVEHEDLNYVIEQLIFLIKSGERSNTLNALEALGSIVRWGNDDDIQVLINKEGLWELERLLRGIDKYAVMDSCWILSNITARKENHIEAVIKHKCIESLVCVIKKQKFVDVKEEAFWAILNAIHGANNDQIICLRDSVKPLWNSLNVFSDNPPIVCACIENLVKMKWVEVTCNGEMVNDAEFKKCLDKLKKKQLQLADDIQGSPNSKRLRTTTDNIGKYDSNIMFHLSVNSL